METATNQPLTLEQAQNAIDQWIVDVGQRYFSELTNLAQLVEEVGELARLMSRLYGDQSAKEGEAINSLEAELGDILFVIICIANQTDVDLTKALRKTLKKNTDRDYLRHQSNAKLRNADNSRVP